jgi:hypothetical protein
MKNVLVITILFFITVCCSKKTNIIPEKVVETKNENSELVKSITKCPQDGKCTTEILKNKSLVVKKDEFGSTYKEIVDNLNTSVIVYTYTRNEEKNIADAGYREEIVFEINNSETTLNLTDKTLQNTKMLFGRFCFCRGQTGYYIVRSGQFQLQKKSSTIEFNLDFKITEVPQVITSINAYVK